MAKTFKGRVVVPGTVTAKALVSHGGFNTLASYQSALMFGDKDVKCGDQNNPDIYKKPMIGVALCLPQTIGSTTGGMVFYTILSDVGTETHMPVVDSLGDEFLEYVKTGMSVTLAEDGTVTVE